MKTIVRRSLVAAGVAGSLAGGGLSIATASHWSSTATPPPAPTVASLLARLDAERARSAALAARIGGLTSQVDQLTAVLDRTAGQASADATTATGLRGQLAAAKAQLAKLEAQIAGTRSGQGGAPRVTTVVQGPAVHATTGASGKTSGDDGGTDD